MPGDSGVGAAGAEGTICGGRGAGEPSKNCALAGADSAASQSATATTNRRAPERFVPSRVIARVFDRNRGEFKPLSAGLSQFGGYASAAVQKFPIRCRKSGGNF